MLGMVNVLLVEDDLENCEILKHYLEKSGSYRTTIVHDAQQAIESVRQADFDLILLDIMLPGIDGIDLCIQLRKILYCPIIFISCLDDDETIVRALRMGGDDYLTKPFRYPVLQAHMESVLRRMQLGNAPVPENLRLGEWLLLPQENKLIKDQEELYLSPTEYAILSYLINNRDKVLKFEEIYQHIWKKPSYGDLRTVFSHVKNLRKKIETDPANPQLIRTVPRVGYLFSLQP